MKASKELKELIMSLKDRVCKLDQGLVVDPRPNFNYGEIYKEINLILLVIEVELLTRGRRKK
jgi:hypothetical protein